MRTRMRADCTVLAFLGLVFGAAAINAQSQCPGDFCDNPITSLCDAGGFRITLVDYTPAAPSNSGFASYTYRICSPPPGICGGTVRPGQACLDNAFCRKQGQNTDPTATCDRECAVDSFRDLSHFDIGLPLRGPGSCLPEGTQINGSCTPGPFSVGQDGSCGSAFVAKCDAGLNVGECYEMTINIAGELNAPGLGAAFMISKESQDCNESCIAGPSCEPCAQEPPAEACLTRTRGFWSTHPHLVQSADPRSLNLLPISVCGTPMTTVNAGVCSTSEALCTSAPDRRSNPPYLSLAAQLTAAKLNLAATAAVSDGTCGDFVLDGMTIHEWIAHCETNFCSANKQAISASGCIEALDAFNNSQDVGFDETPSPFERPGPALPEQCQLARGNGKWVGGNGCSQP